MEIDSTPDYEPVPGAQVTQPRAISLDRASEIAREVRGLVSAGQERVAWERMRLLHPADIGTIVAGLPRASRDVMLAVMSPETVVWILRQMNPVEAGRLGARIGSGMLSVVLRQVRPQVALATLRRLPFLAVRPQLVLETIRRIPTPRFGRTRTREVTAEQVEEALGELEPLAHASDVAGALMVADFPMVDLDERVQEARERLRSLDENRAMFSHVLVRDEAEGFIGQVSMVDLALAENETPLKSMATSVVAIVDTDTSVEECARLQHHYSLTHLPVVEDGEVIGVILGESLVSAAVEEDTRQMMRVASVAGEVVDGPISGSIRTRLPWLTVNLGTTFLAAATVSLFESTLAQVVALAAFLPVVAGQGGIGGTQTLTLIVRAMALGELVGIGAARILVREVILGILHGIWLGLLVAVIAFFWKQNLGLGLVLGLAMFGNMIIAGTVGAGVPLLLRRLGVDPAVASAVVVTTFTDVFGFLLFLGIARAFIGLIL